MKEDSKYMAIHSKCFYLNSVLMENNMVSIWLYLMHNVLQIYRVVSQPEIQTAFSASNSNGNSKLVTCIYVLCVYLNLLLHL